MMRDDAGTHAIPQLNLTPEIRGTAAAEQCSCHVRLFESQFLPCSDRLHRAMRGSPTHPLLEQPLLRIAGELAELHNTRFDAEFDQWFDIDARRAELVATADVWIVQMIPQHRQGATVHTETVGMVIDRFAQYSVTANRLLLTYPPDDDRVHRAWRLLAQLADGYNDLVAAVIVGARRLPE